MKLTMPILILAVTAALLALGTFAPNQVGAMVGVASGAALPGFTPVARTPEQAMTALLTEIRKRNWDAAYSLLANTSKFDEALFVRDLAGANGDLRSYSG